MQSYDVACKITEEFALHSAHFKVANICTEISENIIYSKNHGLGYEFDSYSLFVRLINTSYRTKADFAMYRGRGL